MVDRRSTAPHPPAPKKSKLSSVKKNNGEVKKAVPSQANRRTSSRLAQEENADPEPEQKRPRSKKAVNNPPEASKPRSKKAEEIPEESSLPVQNRAKSLKRVPSRDMEIELWRAGFRHVIGVDEAGRGPLAGPVVAAACIIPANVDIQGIDDSKKLTAEKREQLYSQITSTPGVLYAICIVDAPRIDEINILQATMEAMVSCVEKLTGNAPLPYVLIDGNRIPGGLPEEQHARSVVKGDAECHVIAAASIVAKVTRDRLMDEYHKKWPDYGFKDHKGYGTPGHIAALLKHGPCDIHRRTFAPLRNQILDT